MYAIFHVLLPFISKLPSVIDIVGDGTMTPEMKCHPPIIKGGTKFGLRVLTINIVLQTVQLILVDAGFPQHSTVEIPQHATIHGFSPTQIQKHKLMNMP